MGDWVSASLGRPSNDSPGLVAGRGMAAQPGWMAAQATGELVPTQHLDQCTRGPLEVRPRFFNFQQHGPCFVLEIRLAKVQNTWDYFK